MARKRREYDPQYKFRVALKATKGTKTISQLASETGIHPNQISSWKRQLLDRDGELFSRKNGRREKVQPTHCFLFGSDSNGRREQGFTTFGATAESTLIRAFHGLVIGVKY